MQVIDESSACGYPRFGVHIVEATPAVATVAIQGEVDLATSPHLLSTLVGVLDAYQPSRLEIVLSEVTFLDASGVSSLCQLYQPARSFGCQVILVRPHPHVLRVLDLTGVTLLYPLGD